MLIFLRSRDSANRNARYQKCETKRQGIKTFTSIKITCNELTSLYTILAYPLSGFNIMISLFSYRTHRVNRYRQTTQILPKYCQLIKKDISNSDTPRKLFIEKKRVEITRGKINSEKTIF